MRHIILLFVWCAPLTAQVPRGKRLGGGAVAANVNIKGFNPAGTFRFVGWDKDSVVVFGTIGRGEHLMFSRAENSVKVGADGHWSDGEATPSDLTVYVPRHAMIAAKSVSADLIVENASGWFWSVAGNVRISGQATSLEVESMSGSIDLNATVPWIKARTGSGNLLVRGQPQDVDLSTVSGTLNIASSAILRGRFGSVSGDIHYAALPAPGGIFDFSNHSGSVDLIMPGATSAMLALSTISGPIENGWSQARPAGAPPRSTQLTIGRGDAHLTVRTFKGPIRLRRE